ncbi:MAG: hypothetical protein ABJP02_08600 [Parasphingorhabdus sp.]|uniref:hypothetical protein n=1 Tax=Parasphingorhabdus sp. TaxID=2709688 RepID=UPI0032986CD4
MSFQKTISAAVASTALVFTGFAPAMAAPVNPAPAPVNVLDLDSLGWTADADKAEGWRSHRGYRGYRGYGYGRGYRRHRNRVDAGDVLAGVLIIGGIAAIASAASKNKQDRRYEDRDYRYDRRSDNRRYDDRRSDRRSDNRSDRGTGSMDTAINVCSNAAERQAGDKARVSEIQSVARDGAGWRVEGGLSGTAQTTFLCGATDGRVDFVQLGDGALAFAN